MKLNPTLMAWLCAVGAFLAAWQTTDFALDYRSVLGAVTCAILGYVSPKALKK